MSMSPWQDAQEHAERAQRFYRAGQWERALEAIQAALERQPDESEWHYGRGLTLEALGRYDEAADAFQHSLNLRDPGETNPQVMIRLGIDLTRAGRYHEAIDTFERLSHEDPTRAEGYLRRILPHAKLGEHDAAEVMFYLALQVDPELPGAYHAMGESWAMRKDDNRAAWCWHEALRLDPAEGEVNLRLAKLYERHGEHANARLHYERELRLTPDAVEVLQACGDLLLKMNRLAEAGDRFRRALELDPTLAGAHRRLGELALIVGHAGAATARFERARQLDPDLPGVHLGLAQAALCRGEVKAAREMLHAELRCEGQSVGQTLELAATLNRVEMFGETIQLLTPSLDGADDLLLNDDAAFATGLFRRGVARLAVGLTDEATGDWRRCLGLDPTYLGALTRLVRVYLAWGECDRAAARLGRGLALAPRDRELRRLRWRLHVTRARDAVRRWFRLH